MSSIEESVRGIVVNCVIGLDLYGLVWVGGLCIACGIPRKIDDSVHLLCLSSVLNRTID